MEHQMVDDDTSEKNQLKDLHSRIKKTFYKYIDQWKTTTLKNHPPN